MGGRGLKMMHNCSTMPAMQPVPQPIRFRHTNIEDFMTEKSVVQDDGRVD
jgi:hypothetical protein